MMRAAALALPLLLAGMAAAEEPNSAKEDLDTLGYISAAKPGRFLALPPSANGFPENILARMRVKLGGERPLPAAPAPDAHGKPEASANGH